MPITSIGLMTSFLLLKNDGRIRTTLNLAKIDLEGDLKPLIQRSGYRNNDNIIRTDGNIIFSRMWYLFVKTAGITTLGLDRLPS